MIHLLKWGIMQMKQVIASLITRKEPDDLTNQEWLKVGNYYSYNNLEEDSSVLEIQNTPVLDFNGTNTYAGVGSGHGLLNANFTF